MIKNIITKKNNIAGYKKVKLQVQFLSFFYLDVERFGLKKVNNNKWHKVDLYHALIVTNKEKPFLIERYGKEYLKAEGKNSEIKDIISSKGAKNSVKTFMKYLKKNDLNTVLEVYSIEFLSKKNNGIALAKTIYIETIKHDISLALPYGLWANSNLKDKKLSKHIANRINLIKKTKKLYNIIDDTIINVTNNKITSIITTVMPYCDDNYLEKVIRLNLLSLNLIEITSLLLKRGINNNFYNTLRKICANIWAQGSYTNLFHLYPELLRIKQEKVIAERYVITAIETNNEPDTQLPFIYEIKSGYDNIMASPLSFFNKKWAHKYPNITKRAINYYALKGDLIAAVTLCHQLNIEHPKMAHWQAFINIANNGLALPNAANIQKNYNKNVAYLLYNSLPVHSGGYATRSHGIISNLMPLGINPYAITRLGYPYDLKKFKNQTPLNEEYYKGIVYHRLLDGPGLNFVPINEYLTQYKTALKHKLIENQTSLIHAASNHINGVAAILAGRELGLKSIFEVRGLWEITRLSREPQWQQTIEFDAYQYLETLACKEADSVITITQALKNELIARNIPAEKIHVIPNGVDTDTFMPTLMNTNLKLELNIPVENVVIGYVGSIVDYEGLDLLVESIQMMVANNITGFTALIIGDGVALPELKQQVTDAQLDDYFIFTGRIAHNNVPDYYSIIDVCPFPRRGVPVCELVSPLKPFEAMAMAKVIIGSSVKAISEFIHEGENGLVHEKDDAADLADKLTLCIKDEALRETLKASSRRWVIENRDWSVLASKVNDIYLNSYQDTRNNPEALISCAI